MQITRITRTNLIPNPGLEVNTSSWGTYQASLAWKSGGYNSLGCGHVTVSGSTGNAQVQLNNTISGALYALQCTISGAPGQIVFLQGWSPTVGSIGYTQMTLNGGWQLISNVFTAKDTSFQFQVGSNANGADFYIDNAMVTYGPSVTPYFDGSYGVGYSWSGTPNNSVSYFKQFDAAAVAPVRSVSTGVLISWDKGTASGVNYFAIGSSAIGGNDIIKSGGGLPAFSDQYHYKDYTKYAVSWQTSIQMSQFPYGMISRQADVILNNASNIFTPASGSAIGPYVKTGRPLKLSVGFNNETIGQFVGYSDTPVFDTASRTTSLHCYDVIDYLNSYISQTTPTQSNQRADSIIQLLLEEAGFSNSQFVLEISLQRPITIFAPQGQTIGSLIQGLCEAEGAIFFSDENGIMHFWNRQHFANTTTPVATFSYSNTSNFKLQDTPIINAVKVKANPLTLGTDQKLWEYTSPLYLPALGPNGTNLITNPSFETGTSGWSGSFTRTNAAAYIGSYSLSGTNMVYDISTTLNPQSNGGYSGSIQCFVKAPIGQQFSVTLSGVPISGQAVAGNYARTITGNGGWQNVTVSGSNFSLTVSPGVNAWANAGSLPSTSYALPEYTGYATYSGFVYIAEMNTTNLAYGRMSMGSVGPFYSTTQLPAANTPQDMVAANGSLYYHDGTARIFRSPIHSDGSIGSWSATASLPSGRSYGEFVTYGNYVYYIGGQDGKGANTNSVYYALINGDGTLGSWASTSLLPVSKALFTATAYNGYMYAMGGGLSGTDTTGTYFAQIHADGTLGAWTSTTDSGIDSPSSCAVIGGYIYQAGYSTSNAPLMSFAQLNGNGTIGSWSTTTAYDHERYLGALVADSGYLYLIGGDDQYGTPTVSALSASPQRNGVNFVVSSAAPVLLDAVSSDTSTSYYDGNTPNTTATTYSWTGTPGASASRAVSIALPVTVQASFSSPVLSIDLPQATASGINSSYYFTNTQSDGSGSSLGTSVLVSSAQVNGTTATIVFANTGPTQGYITDIVLWGKAAVATQTIVEDQVDTNSITQYKLNPANGGQIMNISNNYIQDPSSAAGLAFTLVNGYSQPHSKHTSDVFFLPQLQFGDLVAFYNRETGETHNLFVTGNTNYFGVGGAFRQTLTLEERVLSKYFTVGTSVIGNTDQLSP